MGFEDFQPILGQAKGERFGANSTSELLSFFFYVHALDPSHLRVHVTDFSSNTFEAVLSVLQLEDMRDDIGIGGSWAEFVGYVIASIKTRDVKLLVEGDSELNGATCAKFVAQKSKGMPQISISLVKLADAAAADEAKTNLSLELYKAYESTRTLLVNEEERCVQLTRQLSAEQEKNHSLQRQIDTILYSKRSKPEKINSKATLDTLSCTSSQDSPDKKASQSLASTKVPNRVVPTYRRTKVRGFLLQDDEDDAEK